MSQSKKILNNISYLTLGELVSRGSQFLYIFYLSRVILTDGLGSIAFAQSNLAFFIILAHFGTDIFAARELSKDKSQVNKLVNNLFSLKFITSTLLLIAFSILVLLIDKPISIKFVMLIMASRLYSEGFLLNWVYQAFEKMQITAFRQVFVNVLNLLGVYFLVKNPDDTVIASGVLATSIILNSILLIFYYIKEFGAIKFEFDWEYWKYILRSSIPLGITFFLIVIYNNIDMLMIGYLRPNSFTHESGIYDAAHKIVVLMLLPSSIIQQGYFPLLSRTSRFEDRLNVLHNFSKINLFIGVLVTGLTYLGAKYIIHIQFGAAFEESILLLQIKCISLFLMFLNISYSMPLIAWNKEKNVAYSTLLGALMNVILNYFLITNYGIIGAAIATICSELSVQIVLFYSIKKVVGTTSLQLILKIASIPAFTLALIIYLQGMYNIAEYFTLIIYAIICIFAVFWLKIITLNEIKSVLKK